MSQEKRRSWGGFCLTVNLLFAFGLAALALYNPVYGEEDAGYMFICVIAPASPLLYLAIVTYLDRKAVFSLRHTILNVAVMVLCALLLLLPPPAVVKSQIYWWSPFLLGIIITYFVDLERIDLNGET